MQHLEPTKNRRPTAHNDAVDHAGPVLSLNAAPRVRNSRRLSRSLRIFEFIIHPLAQTRINPDDWRPAILLMNLPVYFDTVAPTASSIPSGRKAESNSGPPHGVSLPHGLDLENADERIWFQPTIFARFYPVQSRISPGYIACALGALWIRISCSSITRNSTSR